MTVLLKNGNAVDWEVVPDRTAIQLKDSNSIQIVWRESREKYVNLYLIPLAEISNTLIR